MKYLVTGASGFLGKNFIKSLPDDIEVLPVDSSTDITVIKGYCVVADFVFHFGAVQRADSYDDFYNGNVQLTKNIIQFLTESSNKCPILFSSSIHLDLEIDTNFTITKKMAEDILIENNKNTGRKIGVFRLTHTFGPNQRPNHNSVVSTFCFSIVNNIAVTLNNINSQLNLMYITDVINEFNSFVAQDELFLFKSFLKDGHKISIIDLLYLINELNLNYAKHDGDLSLCDDFEKNLLQTLKFYYC
jgi:UDP-2-acetamido-2,6-beta-L-arabino-hexul-4-ose reductase